MSTVLLVLAVAAIGVQRLLELVLARRNEKKARARGAVERGQGHYPLVVGLHSLWLVSTLVEGLVRGPEPPALWPVAFALFLLVQPLRYWAIFSLGYHWNTKILIVPGIQASRSYLRYAAPPRSPVQMSTTR